MKEATESDEKKVMDEIKELERQLAVLSVPSPMVVATAPSPPSAPAPEAVLSSEETSPGTAATVEDMETTSLLPPTEPGDSSEVDEGEPASATSDPYAVDEEIQVDELSVALALAFSGSDDSVVKVKDEPVECPAPDVQDSQAKPVENPAVPSKPGRRQLTRRELLRNAAKARIRRMVAEKKKRSDLAAPSWLAAEWNKGTVQKEQMAAVLQEVNWCKEKFIVEMEKIVTQKRTVRLVKDAGWYSESEMKNDLLWAPQRITGAKAYCADPSRSSTHTRKNLYDEVTEYWVVVRERGSHEQLHEVENTTKSTEKLQDGAAPDIPKDTFAGLDGAMDRMITNAPSHSAAPESTTNADLDAKSSQNKDHLRRYLDSLLKNTTKLKTLQRDIKTNYEQQSAARSAKTLEDHIKKLDDEYDKLNEHMAKGETSSFDATWWKEASDKMKAATFVTSRATAAEMKIKKSKQFLEKKEGAVPEKPPKSSKRKEPTVRADKEPSQASASKKPKKEKKSKK